MDIRSEHQQNPVADDLSALVAVTRPILAGLLHSIGEEFLAAHGGREGLRLGDLGRVRKANDGDAGVAFEYAVHDAVMNGEAAVVERVSDALAQCRITHGDPRSILFAIEKTGSRQLIDTARDLVTDDSRILSGTVGQPAKLKPRLNQLAAAFHRPDTRLALPYSIQGLWKADLFLGSSEQDRWVGTSIRINGRLEAARGLRVAIVPVGTVRSDRIYTDEQKRLVVCPLPHDYSFMQKFHEGLRIVQTLVAKDFREPTAAELPNPIHREVARIYAERRDFAIPEVLAATNAFAQPELLLPAQETVTTDSLGSDIDPQTSTMIGPIPRLLGAED